MTRLQAFQSFGAASCLVSCCALAAPNSNGGFEASDTTGFSSQALGSTLQPPDSIAFRGLGGMASEVQPFLELTGNIGRSAISPNRRANLSRLRRWPVKIDWVTSP